MTLNEKRLLLLGISKVNPTIRPSQLKQPLEFTISVAEWLETYPNAGGGNPYREIKKATESLQKRSVFLAKRGTSGEAVSWVDRCVYHEKDARITIRFGFTMSHYLCGMLEEFTKFDLFSANKFTSMHTIRIYENLMRFNSTGYRKWLIDDFRKLLVLGNSYAKYAELRRWVIEPAVKEINEKSDLDVTWSQTKSGRKVVGLEFFFKKRAQHDLFREEA